MIIPLRGQPRRHPMREARHCLWSLQRKMLGWFVRARRIRRDEEPVKGRRTLCIPGILLLDRGVDLLGPQLRGSQVAVVPDSVAEEEGVGFERRLRREQILNARDVVKERIRGLRGVYGRHISNLRKS